MTNLQTNLNKLWLIQQTTIPLHNGFIRIVYKQWAIYSLTVLYFFFLFFFFFLLLLLLLLLLLFVYIFTKLLKNREYLHRKLEIEYNTTIVQ